jgi:hypothetical protein
MPTLDEQVRWTAFGLLVRHGRPVAVTDLAGVMPSGADSEAVSEALSRLGAGGQIDIGQGGAVIGAAGLTLGPAPHRLLLRGRDYRTWCAYDAIGIVAALGEPGSLSTHCGICARPIALPLPDAATAERPERLWLSAGGADLRADFCASTVLLCSPEHGETWAQRQGGRGRLLDLRTAARLGAGAWASPAREVARLGTDG